MKQNLNQFLKSKHMSVKIAFKQLTHVNFG